MTESFEMTTSSADRRHGSYTVKAGESLSSIAARVGNVTPAQLARFNRLGMLGASHPPIFPGQRLYIPNKDEISAQHVRLRHIPGTATRVRYLSADFQEPKALATTEGLFSSGSSTAAAVNAFEKISPIHSPVMERLFAKVEAMRILLPSKSQVNGVLIVTPDAVCFDATATATALNRAAATKKTGSLMPNFNSELLVIDIGGQIHSPSPEPILQASCPVHDVLALSLCIPMAAVVSLNTHGDINNLLSSCRFKQSPSKSDLVCNDSNVVESSEEQVSSTEHHVADEEATPDTEDPPLVDVYISIGVSTDRILSSIQASPSASHTTLSEAATTDFHVFKIPLSRLADIHDILVSATILATSRSDSLEEVGDSRRSELKARPSRSQRGPSMIESALEEMESNSFEIALLGDASSILNEAMLKDLSVGLPASRMGSSMRLIFSTAKDGFCLNTLYRKTASIQDVNLLLIRDYSGSVFGALLSEKMHCSQHFYGTGESCVFHWKDGFKCYNWTKKNYYFMLGSHNSFLIGAKSGHSAIWFDGDLKYGRSEATDTFDNPVLCSTSTTAANRIDAPGIDNKGLTPSASSGSLRDSTGPSSVPFVIEALEVWEVFT